MHLRIIHIQEFQNCNTYVSYVLYIVPYGYTKGKTRVTDYLDFWLQIYDYPFDIWNERRNKKPLENLRKIWSNQQEENKNQSINKQSSNPSGKMMKQNLFPRIWKFSLSLHVPPLPKHYGGHLSRKDGSPQHRHTRGISGGNQRSHSPGKASSSIILSGPTLIWRFRCFSPPKKTHKKLGHHSTRQELIINWK